MQPRVQDTEEQTRIEVRGKMASVAGRLGGRHTVRLDTAHFLAVSVMPRG
jgi:hypothetical protein